MSTQSFHPFSQPSSQPDIPLLGANLPTNAGPVCVAYDATTREPLRLRNQDGQRLRGDAHYGITPVLSALEAAVSPLRLDFLKATVSTSDTPSDELDAWRTQAGIIVMIGTATHHPALNGVLMNLRASVRLSQAEKNTYDIDADLRVRLDDTDGIEAAAAAAAKTFSETATRTWAMYAREVLAPWLIGSGVHELRLTGAFRPQCYDPRKASVQRGSDVHPRLH